MDATLAVKATAKASAAKAVATVVTVVRSKAKAEAKAVAKHAPMFVAKPGARVAVTAVAGARSASTGRPATRGLAAKTSMPRAARSAPPAMTEMGAARHEVSRAANLVVNLVGRAAAARAPSASRAARTRWRTA